LILKGLSAWGKPLMETLLTILREVRDPRDMNARHCAGSMLFIALAATLCGAKSAVDIADFGRAHTTILGEIVDLPHGIPSHDCFSRLFRLLDPAERERALRRFGEALHWGARPVHDRVTPGTGRSSGGGHDGDIFD